MDNKIELNHPRLLKASVSSYQEKLVNAIADGEITDAIDQCTLKHHFA